MKLPTEKSKIDMRFTSQKFGIIGASGIGKSEFFAQEDKALFIETEAGLNFLEVFKVPVRSWDELREVYGNLKQLHNEGKMPYTMIVIDTIDRLVDLAEDEIVSKGKNFYKGVEINTIGEIPNGGGWSKTRELIGNFFNKLEELDCAIAFIGHLSIKRVEEGVRKYDRKTISLWAGVGNDMLARADHILHVDSQLIGDSLSRTVYTQPTQSREAKSRGAVIPNGMKWGKDANENWTEFRKLFN